MAHNLIHFPTSSNLSSPRLTSDLWQCGCVWSAPLSSLWCYGFLYVQPLPQAGQFFPQPSLVPSCLSCYRHPSARLEQPSGFPGISRHLLLCAPQKGIFNISQACCENGGGGYCTPLHRCTRPPGQPCAPCVTTIPILQMRKSKQRLSY